MQVGTFQLDIPSSKVIFDENALGLHGSSYEQCEFGIGEWVSLYHADDRGSVLKLISHAAMVLRGFRFQARAIDGREPEPMIECYARFEGGSFDGIFLSSRSHYAGVE